MKLHILTLNWNGEEKLKALAPTLVSATEHLKTILGIDSHWHVRDNGSKDNSIKLISDLKNTTVYPVGHNRDTFARGVNYLFQESGAKEDDLILLLNNDVIIFDPESLAKMVTLRKVTGAGVVGARLLFTNSKQLQHAGVIFSEKYNRLPYHYRPGQLTDLNAERARKFQAVTAACALTDAATFITANGMDERFRWAFEDISYCLEVLKSKPIVYCGTTGIYHEESATLKKNPMNKLFSEANVREFRNKWDGKYELDLEKYQKNPSHNIIE